MGARVRILDLAKNTPKFGVKKEADSALRQRINVVASLASGLLQELEDLRSAITKVITNRSQPVGSLGARVSVMCDQPIDFYKEVESYEIDLLMKALRQTRGNQRRAAQLLNLKTTTLNAKLKNYRIDTFGLALQSAAPFCARQRTRGHERVRTADQPAAPALTEGGRKKARAS